MAKPNERKDRVSWAIAEFALIGLGIGFLFVTTSVLLFVASLLIGIGLGLLTAALIPRRERVTVLTHMQ